MLKALIFDVDGTLVDSERHWPSNRLQPGIQRVGAKLELGRGNLQPAGEGVWSPETTPAVSRFYRGRWAQLDCRRPGGLHRRPVPEKTRHFVSIAETGALSPRPGISRLLHEARQKGLTLAIASSSDETNVRTLLRHAFAENIESWFQYIGAGDTAVQKKPDPEIYRTVLQKLGISPNQCLAFEDSGPGLNAASAAGIPTIVTWNEYSRNDCFQGAALVVEHLEGDRNPATTRFGAGKTSDPERIDLQTLHRVHEHWLNYGEPFPTPSNAHPGRRRCRSDRDRFHCVQPTQHS
jgi:HAD superfamily hydrolase (TIGR01509 family)